MKIERGLLLVPVLTLLFGAFRGENYSPNMRTILFGLSTVSFLAVLIICTLAKRWTKPIKALSLTIGVILLILFFQFNSIGYSELIGNHQQSIESIRISTKNNDTVVFWYPDNSHRLTVQDGRPATITGGTVNVSELEDMVLKNYGFDGHEDSNIFDFAICYEDGSTLKFYSSVYGLRIKNTNGDWVWGVWNIVPSFESFIDDRVLDSIESLSDR